MTFQEWSDSIFTPISYFYDWLCQVADSLINNYIVQTLLCLSIIISLFWLISNYIINLSHNKLSEIDDYSEKLHNYELYKNVQNDYLSNHWDDEFNFRYKHKIISQEVLNEFMQNAQDLDVDNRVLSLENQSIARREYLNKISNEDNKSGNDNLNSNINNDSSWLKEFDNDLKDSINDDVNRIMSKNNSLLEKQGLSYDSTNNVFFDTKTGEVVNISNNDKKDNIIYLGIFSYFDKDSKAMKKIALPIIPGESLQDFQFDNDRLSDFERNFITSNTLIREK